MGGDAPFDNVAGFRIDGYLSRRKDETVGFDRLLIGTDGFWRVVGLHGLSIHFSISLVLDSAGADSTSQDKYSQRSPVSLH